jgi:hypothetical protein
MLASTATSSRRVPAPPPRSSTSRGQRSPDCRSGDRAQNPLNVALLGPLAAGQGRRRNFVWRWFTDPDPHTNLRSRYLPEQHETLGREYVADLRVTAGARGDDPAVRSLLDALFEASAEFRAIWARQEVALRHTTHKVLDHPEVGRLDLECDVVLSPPSGQRLVLFRPRPGTGTAERLALLHVVGTQSFSPNQGQ